MQITFSYVGEPKVSLIVDVPKMGDTKIGPNRVAEIRFGLLALLKSIDEETMNSPDAFATAIFKSVKAKYDTFVLVAVVFSLTHTGGDTILTYVARDLNLNA